MELAKFNAKIAQPFTKLVFSVGNAKIAKDTAIFSLPAGHACPSANLCLSKADKFTGHIQDGPNTEFRCFSASTETLHTNTRIARHRNFEFLKVLRTSEKMAAQLLKDLPKKVSKVRIHPSGDFFTQSYFDAWIMVATARPDLTFYAYTKSLQFWVRRLDAIPANLHLNASYGGMKDHLIEQYGLKFAKVVYSENEAEMLGLKIDHKDTMPYEQKESFALLIHGTQPKGSIAAKAISAIKATGGKVGYTRSHKFVKKISHAKWKKLQVA
jgi:hypothetical protein